MVTKPLDDEVIIWFLYGYMFFIMFINITGYTCLEGQSFSYMFSFTLRLTRVGGELWPGATSDVMLVFVK